MVKRTVQESCPSVTENLVASDFFGYEVSLYRIYKDRVELVGSRLYSSSKKLEILKEATYKREKDYILMKCIDWISAPKEYIEENNLNLIEHGRKRRK